MRFLLFIFVIVLASCNCVKGKDEPAALLLTSKHSPKQRVCRLIQKPAVASGVYCVVYEGPEKIQD